MTRDKEEFKDTRVKLVRTERKVTLELDGTMMVQTVPMAVKDRKGEGGVRKVSRGEVGPRGLKGQKGIRTVDDDFASSHFVVQWRVNG